MNDSMARLLTGLYPRSWRSRYGDEFQALLETSPGNFRTLVNVVSSALCERVVPARRGSCSKRAAWAVFSLGPLLLLGAAYVLACFILWSGWRVFLPEANTPFIPVDGFANVYFAAGRWLYFGAPVLVGWTVGFLASRRSVKAVWPVLSFSLLAVMGSMTQVHAERSLSGGSYVRMEFGPGNQDGLNGLLHAMAIFSLTLLPCLLWRWRSADIFSE